MLTEHFHTLLAVHVGCVALSGTLFTARGVMRLMHVALAHHIALRVGAMIIDTALLTAAILLTLVVHQYPFANDWLTVKFVLLLVYIALGTLALKRARTERGRALAFGAALATFAAIVGVAVTRQPLGWFSLMR